MFPCSHTLSECFRTVIFRNFVPCSQKLANVPLFPSIFCQCSLVPQNPWETLIIETVPHLFLVIKCAWSNLEEKIIYEHNYAWISHTVTKLHSYSTQLQTSIDEYKHIYEPSIVLNPTDHKKEAVKFISQFIKAEKICLKTSKANVYRPGGGVGGITVSGGGGGGGGASVSGVGGVGGMSVFGGGGGDGASVFGGGGEGGASVSGGGGGGGLVFGGGVPEK